GAHVSERGRVAAWAGGISRALQSALDRPALGLPHASPGSPATSCTWSRCMNTLSSVSKKSGAKHRRVGTMVALGMVAPIALFGLFHKTRLHFIGIEYKTADGKGAGVPLQVH